jgi:hypothetical protein
MLVCLVITRNNHIGKQIYHSTITKKSLSGHNPNRDFFKNYCFRDLQKQTLAVTGLCGYAKCGNENVYKM